eukprot:s2178_g9.t1
MVRNKGIGLSIFLVMFLEVLMVKCRNEDGVNKLMAVVLNIFNVVQAVKVGPAGVTPEVPQRTPWHLQQACNDVNMRDSSRLDTGQRESTRHSSTRATHGWTTMWNGRCNTTWDIMDVNFRVDLRMDRHKGNGIRQGSFAMATREWEVYIKEEDHKHLECKMKI